MEAGQSDASEEGQDWGGINLRPSENGLQVSDGLYRNTEGG